ncbi:MAG TPA: hypothetical protein VLX92_14320 [Kofleriaceae bacterium]|nr:hypothetical protein [Kofleriaceae bacterium]
MQKRLYCVALALVASCGVDGAPPPGRDLDISAVKAQGTDPRTPAPVGTWAPLTNTPPVAAAAFHLLAPDGTVILQDLETSNWYRLTPDNTGSYKNGTWSQMGSMPSGYAPLYFSSQWLPDGRLVAMGGEYNGPSGASWTNLGAIYDPTMDKWTSLAAPSGWTTIGDAQSQLLNDGTMMIADCCSANEAALDATSLTWTPTGQGKLDWNDEEGWTMLPDGTILTLDCNVQSGSDPKGTEFFDPTSKSWTAGSDLPVQLADVGATYELGPAPLRGDGTVFAVGALPANAIYDTKTKTWTVGPTFPGGIVGQDAPAAVLPNGNILLVASPPGESFPSPVSFFELDPSNNMNAAPATPNATSDASYQVGLLVLPSGEVMETDFSTDVELYTPGTGPDMTYAPDIISIPEMVSSTGGTAGTKYPRTPLPTTPTQGVSLTTLYAGQTYSVWANRINGVTEGAYYGDDEQPSTGFAIVRLTNMASGHVAFARTHHESTYAIGADVVGATLFDVPATAESGTTQMSIVTNGIPSPAIQVEVR